MEGRQEGREERTAIALEKEVWESRSLVLTASEMTGSGTCIDVCALREPGSRKETSEEEGGSKCGCGCGREGPKGLVRDVEGEVAEEEEEAAEGNG